MRIEKSATTCVCPNCFTYFLARKVNEDEWQLEEHTMFGWDASGQACKGSGLILKIQKPDSLQEIRPREPPVVFLKKKSP